MEYKNHFGNVVVVRCIFMAGLSTVETLLPLAVPQRVTQPTLVLPHSSCYAAVNYATTLNSPDMQAAGFDKPWQFYEG